MCLRGGPIDAYSGSGGEVNDAFAAEEAIDPDDIDRIAANVRVHLQAFCAEAAPPPSSPAGASTASFLAGVRRHPDYAAAAAPDFRQASSGRQSPMRKANKNTSRALTRQALRAIKKPALMNRLFV